MNAKEMFDYMVAQSIKTIENIELPIEPEPIPATAVPLPEPE